MKKCPFCAEDIQDAAVVCKHCSRELTTASSGNVAAGSSSNPPAPATSSRNVVGSLILAGLMLWFWFGGGSNIFTTSMYEAQKPAVDNMMADIHEKVAADAVAQYNITRRNGTLNRTGNPGGRIS